MKEDKLIMMMNLAPGQGLGDASKYTFSAQTFFRDV